MHGICPLCRQICWALAASGGGVPDVLCLLLVCCVCCSERAHNEADAVKSANMKRAIHYM